MNDGPLIELVREVGGPAVPPGAGLVGSPPTPPPAGGVAHVLDPVRCVPGSLPPGVPADFRDLGARKGAEA